MNVLMIENDPVDAELCVHALKKVGVDICIKLAQTREEFHASLAAPCDLIVSDYNLAGWTGLDAFEYARREGIDIPFILVTGALGEEAAVDCMKRGVSDYVLKDRLARLPHAMARALKEKALRDEHARVAEMVRERESKHKEELEARVAERTAQLEAANRDLNNEIDERRRTEKILRESQERFRLLVDGVRDYAIYMLDRQGRITNWTAGAERIHGFRAEDILGRHFSRLYAPQAVEQGQPEADLLRVTVDARMEAERLSLRKDGSVFLANLVLSSLYNSAGGIRGFSAVARDVTEQRRAQEALSHLQLQQQLILDSAGDGIFGLDASGICTFINPAGARMIGYEPGEMTGRVIRESFSLLVSGSGDGSNCPVDAARAQTLEPHSGAATLRRKDGASLEVEYTVTPILNGGEKRLGAVVVFRDITARKAVEKMKDEFTSLVSHELRTPLTAIRAALGLLSTGEMCSQPGKCLAMVKIGLDNTDRLTRLVSDILDLERMQSGKFRMEMKPCDAAQLLQHAAELMRPAAAARGVAIEAAAMPIAFAADPDRVIQVLINLLSNAIKFSPPSSTIWASAEHSAGSVVFRVKDSGRGIPAEKLSLIFERFQQVDASDARKMGGTGLGLAICRSIADQHNGRILVESEPGKGSVFSFFLPARVDSPSLDQSAAPEEAS